MGDIEAGRRVLAAWNVEWELLKLLPNVLRAQAKIGVDTPLALMLTLVGVEGCALAYGTDRTGAMRQDVVEVPPETVEAFGVDAGAVLQPTFDRIWNAGGWQGSPHFEDGKWCGR